MVFPFHPWGLFICFYDEHVIIPKRRRQYELSLNVIVHRRIVWRLTSVSALFGRQEKFALSDG
ncbi:hypothetical protein CSC3H3_20695 (plasmid) [Thalassospira marina]|uniref:Uncharacterized protein n=1 Tax=Thalassospira marina TaxID=2048283 RepID=A0ABN5FLW6_9PROT|nr:hypothetical protein CSC3H3_20695 [Thalassospira marina]